MYIFVPKYIYMFEVCFCDLQCKALNFVRICEVFRRSLLEVYGVVPLQMSIPLPLSGENWYEVEVLVSRYQRGLIVIYCHFNGFSTFLMFFMLWELIVVFAYA